MHLPKYGTRWRRLHPEVVEMVWQMFGKAGVDLFASDASTHCQLWFSQAERSSLLGQDKLAHPWPDLVPIPLLLPTLHRIDRCNHLVLLIAPYWPVKLALSRHCITVSDAFRKSDALFVCYGGHRKCVI